MGVTIKSPNYSIDLGSGGFMRLRRTVSELCPPEIRIHYAYLLDHYQEMLINGGMEKYDETTKGLRAMYHKRYGKVIDFLYASDCDAKLSYGTCKQLLQVIGDYDDERVYGYAGLRDKAARFRDFKRILKDCYENKKPLIWY